MKKQVLGGCIALFTVGCFSKIDVEIDVINDIPSEGYTFAVFDDNFVPTDVDGDGINDFDTAGLQIVISNRDDICDQIAANPDALTELDDVQAISLLAAKVEAVGQGSPFSKGDSLISNRSIFNIAFDPQVGDTSISVSVSIREGGVAKVAAFDDGLLSDESPATLEIDKIKTGEELSASFTSTLVADLADPTRFNTDFDGDGVNDIQLINALVDVKVKNISFCDALIQ